MASGIYQEISPSIFSQLRTQVIGMGLIESYLDDTHQLEFSRNQEWLIRISLPWSVALTPDGMIQKRDDYHLAMVMIRAGIANTGYFHNGELIDHKVFRAYMVRQKQGKSQIKYLKTKGKSRAGSRVRLGESELFFEEINERLNQYAANYPIDHWGISCSKTLWPFFFGASISPPFDKKQENLMSIPFHVQHPDFETLQEIHRKVNAYHVLFSEGSIVEFGDLLSSHSNPEQEDSEDW
ncbi:hypothetical protein FHS59_004003 [Algoriphagus iocasae]|uniref:VLRF1 domain-containing protein n=1 Tax=Algoriphagus iocasae TaxID=1836499 RepID=A0A841MLN0_9BACT|nr:hypothetical protein [Algoriphagus iocasae]MBB6328360.1 hypothetical protein [Algoriphagus iocasae]